MKTYYDHVRKDDNTALHFPSFKNRDGIQKLMASMTDNLALGSGNYTVSRIWNGMTITNALSNTGVKTSSKAWDGWWGSHRTPSIIFTPYSDALTAIYHRNAPVPKCSMWTCAGRHTEGEIPEHDDMLTDIKSMLTVGDKLVAFNFMSDRTHLSNFAGDKREWPVYMTISNLSSMIRQMPSTRSVVMVAHVPIPIKNRNIPQKRLDEQRQTNWQVLNKALQRVLKTLTLEQNCSPESRYYNILCADGNFRCCKPIFTAWLADYPEHSGLHHLEQHVCFWCECPKNELGDYVPPDNEHPRWDHNLYYWMLSDANTKIADAELSLRHVHRRCDVFRHNPCIVSNLPKPDLLHTIQIGMLGYLQKSIFHFMKTHERLNKYNAIWLLRACLPQPHTKY